MEGSNECFPCPLGHQGASWAPRTNAPPSESPSCCTKPKPHPYIQHPKTPSNPAGPKPCPHTPLPPNSTVQGTPQAMLLFPAVQVLSLGPTPKAFSSYRDLSLGPAAPTKARCCLSSTPCLNSASTAKALSGIFLFFFLLSGCGCFTF